ncbi:P-loop ATPase, Sll1717 family [Pantoea agglomerans]|uniref:P-loop ATPase, Sll1717 family n=1 Tax=Enterobacter agglomerans TaxID=549 RepID=UPI001140963A|nr:hypothetical protein [Pantoea agglomerans]
MKSLSSIKTFGGTDADNDEILLKAFEDHEAYEDIINFEKFLVVGKKGSGKTAIFKKIITTRQHDVFSYGHTFSDYPWHFHQEQARAGIPNDDKYTHSWKYLILISLAKIVLNQDQSLPCNDVSLENLEKLEAFIIDAYGSRDPDITQVFNPQKQIKIKPHFELNFSVFKGGASAETIPMSELPTIIQEVNAQLLTRALKSVNPDHKYFIAFDQLDLGFDISSEDYISRLIGLLLAARSVNIAAKEAGVNFIVAIFLRDDIYNILRFEDKNKITENFLSLIEWDTVRTQKTLKSLMEKRFSILLGDGSSAEEFIPWESVFNEKREMPGHQTKYDHMKDRTYLRPRDMIKFANSALAKHRERLNQNNDQNQDDLLKIDNIDIHSARGDYSEYFLREIDDEVHKHFPDYEKYLDVLRSIGTWQFDKDIFENTCQTVYPSSGKSFNESLEALYDYSFIGFYKAGGSGYGGSEYIFKYRDSRTSFSHTASRFRIHPGLIEVLGVKKL